MKFGKQLSIIQRIIIAVLSIAFVIPLGGWSLFGGGDATPEQMIEDFSKMTVSTAEKKLGNKSISYESGISIEYATYKGKKYDEIRLFYDESDKTTIQDINFIMDYVSNKEDVDNLIWAFNQKFGAPDTGTSKANNGSYDYNYYNDSNGNVVAYVKLYDYGKAEVDYYYTGYYEPKPLTLFDLTASTDLMTVLRSIDHYYTIDTGSNSLTLNYGDVYMFAEQHTFSKETKFYFDKSTRKLKEFSCDFEPYYYTGQDDFGRAVSDMMYGMDVQGIHDKAVEKWGAASEEPKSYSSGIRATEYTWDADGIKLTLNYNSNRTFLYYEIQE